MKDSSWATDSRGRHFSSSQSVSRSLPRNALLGILLSGMATPGLAQVQWSGAVDDDWFEDGNWFGGTAPIAGDSVYVDGGPVLISGAAAQSADATIQSPGAVTVTNPASSWNVSSYLQLDDGVLNVQAGGSVQTDILFFNSGSIALHDADTELSLAGDFIVGRDAAATTLTIEGGARLSAARSFVGEGANTVQAASLAARVSGAGSIWEAGGFLSLGGNTTMEATIDVDSGGLVHVEGGAIIGRGGLGKLTVTGAGSGFRATDSTLVVGDFFDGATGHGTLVVGDGAVVSAASITIGGGGAATTGTLRLGGTPGARGVLAVGSLYEEEGSASVLFDGGILRATESTPSFLTDFEAGDLVIGAGGLFIDTDAHDVIAASVLSGVGALEKNGDGTLALTAANTYAGGTFIKRGTLEVGSDANLGDAAGAVELDGGVLRTVASFASSRNVRVATGGTIQTAPNTTFTYDGLLLGNGPLAKTGAGVLRLSGNNAAFTGAVTVEAGVLALRGTLGGDAIVRGGTRLEGDGTLHGVSNFGVVAPGNAGFGTLTVTGDYVGNGGSVEIEAALGADGSTSDRLVIGGASTGLSRVTVINRNGLGAQTVEGIRIIEVAGSSTGNFVLDSDYLFQGNRAIVAGAYAYRLVQNGVNTPADGDWYLRSALIAPPEPPSPEPEVPQPEPPGPLYQPGVPIYEGYVATLQRLNGLQTLQQRVAGRSWAAGRGDARGAVWGRIDGSRQDAEARRSTTGAEQHIDASRLQFGLDHLLVGSVGSSQLVGGVSVFSSEAHTRTISVYGDGRIVADGSGIGLSLTWKDLSGFYADMQAQFSWYKGYLRSDTLGDLSTGNHGSGEAYSLEFGRALAVGPLWSVTPQLQTRHAKVRFNSFVDPWLASVELGDGDNLRSRMGLSIDRRATREGAASHVYAVANLNAEWRSRSAVIVSGTPIQRTEHRMSGGLGIGASVSRASGVMLYGEVAMESPFRDFGDSRNLRANVGLRMSL